LFKRALNLYFSLDARGRGQNLLHDGGAMTPRKFISNFERPTPSLTDAVSKKLRGENLKVWARPAYPQSPL
jgi:hypothetical protein